MKKRLSHSEKNYIIEQSRVDFAAAVEAEVDRQVQDQISAWMKLITPKTSYELMIEHMQAQMRRPDFLSPEERAMLLSPSVVQIDIMPVHQDIEKMKRTYTRWTPESIFACIDDYIAQGGNLKKAGLFYQFNAGCYVTAMKMFAKENAKGSWSNVLNAYMASR